MHSQSNATAARSQQRAQPLQKAGVCVFSILERKVLYPAQWSHGGKRFVCLFRAKATARHFQIGDEMPELLDVHASDVVHRDICFPLVNRKSAALSAVA